MFRLWCMVPASEKSKFDLNLGMPQSGSEPKFEPELFRTGPKFGPRFGWKVEPDHKSGSRFEQG